MEQPATGRLRWQHLGGAIYLRLRARRPWQLIVGPAVFLGLLFTDNSWSRGVRPLLERRDLALPGSLFLLLFGLVLLLQLSTVLWLLFSQETLLVSSGSVEIKRQLAGLSLFRRHFNISDLTLVEVQETPRTTGREFSNSTVFRGFKGGTLSFNTASEQVAFGRDLDPAEARAALHELVALRALPTRIVSLV